MTLNSFLVSPAIQYLIMVSILFYEIDGILVWFGLVSVLFLQNGSRRRKNFIDFLATFHHQEKPRPELEAGTEAEE